MARILIFDVEPYYQLKIDEEDGNISVVSKAWGKQRLLSQHIHDGYLRVKLNNKPTTIHSLVARYCLGIRPQGLVINHKDGDKLNNRPSNLEYITQTENVNHAVHVIKTHVANHPTKHGHYKDGRATKINRKTYQQNWSRKKYLANKQKLSAYA